MHTVENSLRRTSCTNCGFEVAPHTPYKPDTNLVMSPNFAQFLLDTTNNGNEILAVLEDIVEVVETGGTDLQTLE